MSLGGKKINDEEYDDSENDSDYAPENDPDADHDIIEDGNETKLTTISFSRKRKVDDLWASMQQEDDSSKNKNMVNSSGSSSTNKSSKKSSSNKKSNDILAAIFGKKQSTKIVNGVSSTKSSDKIANELSIKEIARQSVKKLQKNTTVTETRKFAGQEITIERKVKGSSSSSVSVKQGNSAKISALDSVLDTIKGPKSVSTVAKSNFDWETYKEKEGLEDDLAAATKDGFLTRKDFLERCDYRAYEQERDERLLKPSASTTIAN